MPELSFTPWSVSVLAASVNPDGQTLFSYKVVMPRSILAEGNTHRALSRNAASSRAVPTRLFIQRIIESPYVPDWTKNGKGMTGAKMSADECEWLTQDWLEVRNCTIARVIRMIAGRKSGVTGLDIHFMSIDEITQLIDFDWQTAKPHKQDINRLLEPWLFMDWIVSGTDWANFNFQRVHRAAHPAFQRIAYPMAKLQFTTPLDELHWGDWHLPMVQVEDIDALLDLFPDYDADEIGLEAAKLSAARCGRVSYLKSDKKDVAADLKWYHDHIVHNTEIDEPPHVSPAEHPAIANYGRHGNYKGFRQLRQTVKNENREQYTLERLNAYEREMDLPITESSREFVY